MKIYLSENMNILSHLLLEMDTTDDTFQSIVQDIKRNGEVVYHRPEDARGGDKLAVIKSLFKRGFSREYTGSNGGNMYGTGVYNVYKLVSSNEKANWYGSFIVKSYVIDGFRDFLIFNSDIAKKYYGKNWWIGNQIKLLMPTDMANSVLKHMEGKLFMNDNHDDEYKRTAQVAYEIFRFIGESKMFSTKIRGLIFSGGHDGCVAFIRDFTAVCPYAYSSDNGKTWKIAINKELVQHLMGNIDTDFELKGKLDNTGKKKFDDVSRKSINGYAIVYKNGKANYYSVETKSLISDIWFDFCSPFDEYGFADVKYDKYNLTIHKEGNEYIVGDENGMDICPLNDLKQLLNQNK